MNKKIKILLLTVIILLTIVAVTLTIVVFNIKGESSQGEKEEETINNNISSIYYFDIWRFKDEYYYKFVMRSHNEYMFKDIYGEVEEIKNELDYLNIKIEGKI